MSDIKKFEESELQSIKTLQDKFNNIILQLGQISVEFIKLEEGKKVLETEFLNLKKEESELASKFNEKYGPGVLDPTTGNFTPQK